MLKKHKHLVTDKNKLSEIWSFIKFKYQKYLNDTTK